MGWTHARREDRDPLDLVQVRAGESQGGAILHPQQVGQIGGGHCPPLLATLLP